MKFVMIVLIGFWFACSTVPLKDLVEDPWTAPVVVPKNVPTTYIDDPDASEPKKKPKAQPKQDDDDDEDDCYGPDCGWTTDYEIV